MQQLHLVGFTTDLESLILSSRKGAKSGSFMVPLDERLLEEIADAVRRRNDGAAEPLQVAPRRSSSLTPREIQARLRSGRSIAAVAREASADEDWVANFAPPVMAERGRVISTARGLVFSKPRLGSSAEPLGLSVRWNLADRGIRLADDEFDACWDAFHIGDAAWGVTFDVTIRGRRQRAEWEVDIHDGEVVARNRLASDFGYLQPGRRRRLAYLIPEAPSKAASGNAGAASKRTNAPAAPPGSPPAGSAKGSSSRAKARRTAKGAKIAKTAKTAKTARNVSGRARKANAPTRSAKTAKVVKAGKTSKGARAKKAAKRPAAGSRKRAGGPPDPSAALVRGAPVRSADAPKLNELQRKKLELVQRSRTPPPPRAAARTERRVQPPGPPRLSPLDVPAPPSAPAPEPEPSEVAPRANGANDDTEAARQRREERRRARAAARARTGEQWETDDGQDTAGGWLASERDERDALPDDDGRVVKIRASQAGGGDVIVAGGRPALRPARPAAQPRRRGFRRTR